ncbi:MAG: hypothetical protein A3E83_00100 [Gammaproteobacteria bacterium RIFCSPHIGHO2_12_FULL_41_20]|nr:MAG: hypothetical protein A3E83_00100 [Gammaproteobacteria bacterium RIFCSPHIGHO2_12_FULL_41_20]
MNKEKKYSLLRLLRKVFLAPLILCIIGSILSLLFLADIYYPQTYWDHILTITSKLGYVTFVLALILFFYNVVATISDNYKKKYLHENKKIAYLVASIIHKELRLIFILFAAYTIISLADLPKTYIEATHKTLYVALVCLIGWTILQILTATEAVIYRYSTTSSQINIRKRKALYTKMHIFKSIAATFVIVITLAAALMVFDHVKNIGISILASAGFLTALLGLAAQRSLSSMFAGIQLVLSQPIKIDDIVIIENEQGTIEEITLNYIVVKLWDGRRTIIPIQYFNENPFQTLTHAAGSLIGTVIVYTDYILPVEAIRETLKHIVENSAWWDKQTATVQVLNLKETCVELRILISASSPDALSSLRLEVREKLLEFIRQHYTECLPKQRITMLGAVDNTLKNTIPPTT